MRQVSPNTHIIEFVPLHFLNAVIDEGRVLPFENLGYDIASAEMNIYCVQPVRCVSVRALSSSDGKSISSPLPSPPFKTYSLWPPVSFHSLRNELTLNVEPCLLELLWFLLFTLFLIPPTSGLLHFGLSYQAGVPPIQVKNIRQYNCFRNMNYIYIYLKLLLTAGLWETWLGVENVAV